MHSGILDHFPISLTSKEFMLDFSNEPIHIAKREIYNKSITYFKTLLSIVDWKHALNENSPNNVYHEFWKILGVFYNEAFPKQNIKISRNPEKELNYKQYRTLSESLIKKSKKNYYPDLIDSDKLNNKKTWDFMREIIGNKAVSNDPLPNFITVKNREIFVPNLW